MLLLSKFDFGCEAAAPSFFGLDRSHPFDIQNEQKLDVLNVCARVNTTMAYMRMWSISCVICESSQDKPPGMNWRSPMSAMQSCSKGAGSHASRSTPDVLTAVALDLREVFASEVWR